VQRWLSLGGRQTLGKSILEAIPNYWHTLAYVLVVVLEKLGRKLLNLFALEERKRMASRGQNGLTLQNQRRKGDGV
jgi:hypothetical protein